MGLIHGFAVSYLTNLVPNIIVLFLTVWIHFSEYWVVGNEEFAGSKSDLSAYFTEIARIMTEKVVLSGSLDDKAVYLPLSEHIQYWKSWEQSFHKVMSDGDFSLYISRELE